MGSFISAVITDIGDLLVQLLKIILRFIAKEKIAKLLYIVLYILSIISLYNLPNNASKTRVSEMNLKCDIHSFFNDTHVNKTFYYSDRLEETYRVRGYYEQENALRQWNIKLTTQMQYFLNKLGFETQLHRVYLNDTTDQYLTNVIGILRAERAMDNEGFVLTSRYDTSDAFKTIGLQLGLASYLSSTKWQGRDLIWVFTDESHEISGIESWLEEYQYVYNNQYQDLFRQNKRRIPSERFLRAGRLFGAISMHQTDFDFPIKRFIIYPEGLGGVLPNLDIVNTVTTTAYLHDTTNVSSAGLNPYQEDEPIHGTANEMFYFLWHTALSFPRANHAFFSKFGINSVGVSTNNQMDFWSMLQYQNIPKLPFNRADRGVKDKSLNYYDTTIRMARLIEAVVHNLHNADELLHQSYRWYSLVGITDYIETGPAAVPIILHIVANFVLITSLLHLATASQILAGIIDLSAKLFGCLLLYSFPKFLSRFPKLELKAELDTLLALYSTAITVLYLVIFKPVARKLRATLLFESRSGWNIRLACSLLYYQFILFVAFTLNIQFGLLFLVPTIPVIILAQPQRILFKLLTAVLCFASQPVLLFVFYWGYQALGLNAWLRIFIYSADHWSSLLWPFVTLFWIPLLCTELSVIFTRDNKTRID
jgi:hypothetical protein